MSGVLVTGSTVTQKSPFLWQRCPWSLVVLIQPTHGRMASGHVELAWVASQIPRCKW